MKLDLNNIAPAEYLSDEANKLINEREAIMERDRAAAALIQELMNGPAAEIAIEADAAETAQLVREGKPGTNRNRVKHQTELQTALQAQRDLSTAFTAVERELGNQLKNDAVTLQANMESNRSKAYATYQRAINALFKARHDYHALDGLERWANLLGDTNPDSTDMYVAKLSYASHEPHLELNPRSMNVTTVTPDQVKTMLEHDLNNDQSVAKRAKPFA